MRAVVQRVQSARVTVAGETVASIGTGLLTLLGVGKGDDEAKTQRLVEKIVNLRIFEDAEGKMNLSLRDRQGAHLIVSQFTLLGDCSRGTRPSFSQAETPERAKVLYDLALQHSQSFGVSTHGGVFRALMEVSLVNEGPVTVILEL